jgi:DNA helicase-2/ATP-dependent DNA helicase PcrA
LLVASSIHETLYNRRADYSDFAILYRTNAQSRIFEDSLRKNNIPYRIYGGISFYQRAEIKDALAYMRLAANPADDEAFRRVVNYPARGIGNTTMERLQNAATANNASLWTTLLTASLSSLEIKENIARKLVEFANLIHSFAKRVHTDDAYTFATDVIRQSGMMNDLKSNNTPEGVSRLENIEELLNGIKEYAAGKQDGDESSDVMPITEYLQNVALITDADKDNPEDRNKVSLMTVHSAKGLEFDYVYVAGMEEGLFPGTMSAQSENGLEEERRLFYVAITRAAKLAVISHAQTRYKWGNLSTSVPSRFLRDIDCRFLDDNEAEPSQQTTFRKRFDDAPSVKPELKRLNTTGSNEQSKQRTVDSSLYGDIRLGVEVSHVRFGLGKITGLSEVDGNLCASIEFYEAGKKTLLLKFAKLTVI